MLVDLMNFCEECAEQGIKISQKKLCEIIETNRYTVSMAMNDNEGLYNIPPDKGIKLWLFNPDAIELPPDFFWYTKATFYAAKGIEGLNIAEIARRVKMPLTTVTNIAKGNNYFLYDHKVVFGAFTNLYVPKYKGKEVIENFDNNDFKQNVLEYIKSERIPKKVSREQLMVNMAVHGMDPSRINTLRKQYKEEMVKVHGRLGLDVQDAILFHGFAKTCKHETVRRPDEN